MSSLFLTVLNMSITAAYVAVTVMIVRLLIKKAPKVFSYALWAVVLFRLLCPVSFESSLSLIPIAADPFSQEIVYSQNPSVNTGIVILDHTVNRSMEKSLPPVNPANSVNPMGVIIEIASIIWILGVILLLAYGLISYLKLKNKLKKATLVSKNTFETDKIQTPFVLGLTKPKIYIPTGLSGSQLDYIIKHEQTHIRRYDYIIKPLAFAALALHWFNPLIWISFILMTKDMEMSCDEEVMKQSNADIRADYSKSLLALSARQSGLLVPLAFGESNVKSRIRNVLTYKKPAFWIVIITFIAVLAVTAGLLANPSEDVTNEYIVIPKEVNAFAWEFINRDIENYEANPEVKIIDSKITRLELVERFDSITDTPVDVYALEYRLLPRDLKKVVLAGGMDYDENGWLKETCSMGSPLLVVSRNADSPELLGILWTGGVKEEGGLKTSVASLLNREIEILVEENLELIMSSPKEASNPYAYIDLHREEYEKILKYGGEKALTYMLFQFESGNAEGLRGAVMMQLCKDLLGARNNNDDPSLSPQDWYEALDIRQEIMLPDFVYSGKDSVEKLVYRTETEQNSQPQRGFTIVAPKVFVSYEEDDLLKVFVTTYSATYKLYGNKLDLVGGSVVPAAITYRKNNNGVYELDKYQQARDGSEFAPSIREFSIMPVSCNKIPGLADKILNHYENYEDLRNLQADNLARHLKANGINDATLTNPYGEIEFSLSSPEYRQ